MTHPKKLPKKKHGKNSRQEANNTRQMADRMETEIVKDLQAYDPNFQKTAGSGGRMDDGDIKNEDFGIECKIKSKAIVGITESELKHLKRQCTRDGRDWVFVVDNKNDNQRYKSIL